MPAAVPQGLATRTQATLAGAGGRDETARGNGLMQVFLVRHAVAHERNRVRWPNDALRPLTPDGKRKFRKAARGLARWVPKSAALLSSPWVRAGEPAAIRAEVAKHARVIECPELTGDAAVHETFELLRQRREQAVVL